MKTARFLALACFSLIIFVACDSAGIDQSDLSTDASSEEVQSADAPNPDPLMPDKALLGSEYEELESKRKINRRVFERADGKRVAIFRSAVPQKEKKGDGSAKDTRYATDQSRSFYRYTQSKFVLEPYGDDNTQLQKAGSQKTADDGPKAAKNSEVDYDYGDTPYELVGNLPSYAADSENETFRLGLRFSGFSDLNVGTVNDIRFEFDPQEAFPSTDRRDGTIKVLEYDSDPTSQFPSQSVFDALADGDQLFEADVEPEDIGYDFRETYTSGDNFFDYFEPAVKNGNEISVSVVADDESTTGAALSVEFIDVVVTYDPPTPPAQAPSSPPSLISPDDGATIRTAANLDWSNVSAEPAADYTVQLDEDPNFGSPRTQTVNFSSATFDNLTVDETYYWRVKAFNSEGSTSFSSSRQFTRGDDQLTFSINGPDAVTSGEQRNWTVSVSGGNGPGSYSTPQWSARQSYANTFTNIGTGSSIDYTFSHTEQVRQDARIRVRVNDGEQYAVETMRITVFASEDDACKGTGKIVACP